MNTKLNTTLNFTHLNLQRPSTQTSKDRDHALQRIIEVLQEAKIFNATDTKWGAMYWRTLLKRHCKKYDTDYVALESVIGKQQGRDSFGLMKELLDLPSKYPAYGWLRNRLK